MLKLIKENEVVRPFIIELVASLCVLNYDVEESTALCFSGKTSGRTCLLASPYFP